MRVIRFITQTEKDRLDSGQPVDDFKKPIGSDSYPDHSLVGKFLFTFIDIPSKQNYPTAYTITCDFVVVMEAEPVGYGNVDYHLHDPWEINPDRAYWTETYREAYLNEYGTIIEIVPVNEFFWR